MPSITIGIGAGLAGLGSIAQGAIGASAAGAAGKEQLAAGQQAAANTQSLYNQAYSGLSPFITGGQNAYSELNSLTAPGGALTAKFQPTMAQLEQTPGYQFSLQQGEEAAQSGFAANGLASSGAALKGGAQYAEGLAGTTYQQQFNNNLAYQNQVYNMLAGESQIGEGAAATNASAALSAAGQEGNFLVGGAAGNAAGTIAAANQINGAIGGVTGAASNLGAINYLNGLQPTQYTQLGSATFGGGNSNIYSYNPLNPSTPLMTTG